MTNDKKVVKRVKIKKEDLSILFSWWVMEQNGVEIIMADIWYDIIIDMIECKK